MTSHPAHFYTPQKSPHRRDSRPSSSLSVQSSSSQSSRESSASRSPCKQCQLLKERIPDFYEESIIAIASRSMSKCSDGESSVNSESPFVTPTKRWKNSPKNRPKTPTTPIHCHSNHCSPITTPIRSTSSLAMKSVSTGTEVDNTPNSTPKKTVSTSTVHTPTKTVSTNTPSTPMKPTMAPEKAMSPPKDLSKVRKNLFNESPKPPEKPPAPTVTDKLYLPILLIFITAVLFIFQLIKSVQPKVFIDEFFHVAQSQQYCLSDNFTHWDNKITTPPGLYLSSYVLLKPLELFTKSTHCSISYHRFTNVIFTFGIFLCLKSILQERGFSRSTSGLFGLTFALFPPLFFPFSFLYYTDVGSLLTLLILLKCSKHNLLVIPIGLISLLYRQTNIVWLFYIASGHALQEFFTLLEDVVHFSRHEFLCAGFRSSFFRPTERHFSNKKYTVHFLLHLGWRFISQLYGFIFNAVAFVAFLYINDGIVLGDRSAHQASFHLAQVPYFLTFCGLFGMPILCTLKNLNSFLSFARKHPFRLVSLLTFLTICLTDKFTFVHPYLLADNRHYTFYLWKKLWSRNALFRYGPVPIYAYIAFTMYRTLHIHSVLKKQNSPFKLYERSIAKALYILVLFVTIVPQQLIEFRYFIVPFVFWRLNIRSGFSPRELAYFVSINIVTIAIFCLKTIQYSASQPKERIIW